MVMDTNIRELSGMINGFKFGETLSDQGCTVDSSYKSEEPDCFFDRNNLIDLPFFLSSGDPMPPASTSPQGDSTDDSEIFSDIALNYISKMLLEEDIDDKVYTYQECPALHAAEKPFYDILGEKYPPSPDQPPLYVDSSESPEDSSNGRCGNSYSGSSHSGVLDNSWDYDFGEFPSSQIHNFSVGYSSQSSFSCSNSIIGKVLDGFEEPVWQFNRGVEEASKFLPDSNKFVIDIEANNFLLPQEPGGESRLVEVKAEEEDRGYSVNGSRGRKNPHHEDLDLEEGRSNKQSAVYSDETVRSEMFDMVLLCNGEKCNAVSSLQEALQNEVSKNSKNGHLKGPNGGKSRGKKQVKKELVDLRTLLIHCAQAVATDDRRSANELLKQVRQHSSPFGDGSQRLAHCFADGLEARLAGTGSQIYHSLVAKRQSATAILKAYHLYLAACPFKKISHFFSNQTILNVAERATRLHIIDFGIYFGFQWPCLIQRLAGRHGGPPKLRITGIEVPQPGFRPTERIEETGRRLADYAQTFGVPFEYHPIASKWEAIRVEDLKIDRDEVLVVNCLYRFKNLVDETVVVDSPRNMVLNNIRKMNPDVFIHGITNGAYSAPFFVTRFREALFHFSALFDMLETTVPREHPERLLIETEIFVREAMNVIACEGSERVERPETYKQWQVRNLRAGFVQLPLNPDIMKKSKDKVKSSYNEKDFVVDQDSRWLLQGWKGRIICALSTWRPNSAGCIGF